MCETLRIIGSHSCVQCGIKCRHTPKGLHSFAMCECTNVHIYINTVRAGVVLRIRVKEETERDTDEQKKKETSHVSCA